MVDFLCYKFRDFSYGCLIVLFMICLLPRSYASFYISLVSYKKIRKIQKQVYQVYLRKGLLPEIVLVAIVNIFT